MDPKNGFPFLTRDLLTYGKDLSIELVVQTKSLINSTTDVFATVITRNGITRYPVTTSNAVGVTEEVRKLDDFPTMISVVPASSGIDPGELYVTVYLRLNGISMFCLASGLVWEGKGLSWPTNVSEQYSPVRGSPASLVTANPAAGAEISYTTSVLTTIEFLAAAFTLVTDATVISRRVHLQILFATGAYFDFVSTNSQSASQTRHYSVTGSMITSVDTSGTEYNIPLPHRFLIPSGSTIRTSTTNIQAGDNYGVASIEVLNYAYDSGG